VHASAGKNGWSVTAKGIGRVGRRGGAGDAVATRDGVGQGGHVRDVFSVRVLGADGGHACVGGFACFGEGIVAGVEVLAFLESVSRSLMLMLARA
jgi:hypothetical protein